MVKIGQMLLHRDKTRKKEAIGVVKSGQSILKCKCVDENYFKASATTTAAAAATFQNFNWLRF